VPIFEIVYLIQNVMVPQEIKVGDIVRHIHIMSGTNLSVIDVMGNKLMVRYANQGNFSNSRPFSK
jgi:hypothetical protein